MSDPSAPTAAGPSVAAPGAPLEEGMRAFGKYVLVRKLAQGGMAEIFLAKQVGAEGFERNVVIKRMLKDLSGLPEFVGMFLDEARLAARLSHQNIVQINDLGLADGWYYICMEYLAGEDFSTVIRTSGRAREYAPLGVVCRVIADAANGLHFAHAFTDERGRALGIVHRDVSPSNIYVTYDGQVKVLDFGIAKAESRLTNTATGVVKGKYMYMAPEQARGEPVDRRADVFSLGVSLYEALTHVRPFARENDLAILNAVLKCEFKRPRVVRPDLPEDLERIVLKAMSGSVEDRYQTAGEMAHDLEAFLAGQSASSGGAQVAQFVRTLFGDQRVTNKTRIPTLRSLVPQGMQLPSFTDAKTQAVAVSSVSGEKPSGVHEAGTQLASAQELASLRRSHGRSVLVASVVASLIAVGGALAGMKFLGSGGRSAQETASQQPAVAAKDSVATQAASAVPEATDAGVVAGGPDAIAAVTQKPVEDPDTRKANFRQRPKPVQLDARSIQRVVSRGSAPIMRCFDTHKNDLAADKGNVAVKFTILSSGRVKSAEVQGPLHATGVGSCLARNVQRLRFPVNVDEEITLTLPFNYTVQR